MAFSLQESVNEVILSRGDIIVDTYNNSIGVLFKKIRRIDIEYDDLYFWEVAWTVNLITVSDLQDPDKCYLEEDGLKLSIVIELYEWFPVRADHKNFTEK